MKKQPKKFKHEIEAEILYHLKALKPLLEEHLAIVDEIMDAHGGNYPEHLPLHELNDEPVFDQAFMDLSLLFYRGVDV